MLVNGKNEGDSIYTLFFYLADWFLENYSVDLWSAFDLNQSLINFIYNVFIIRDIRAKKTHAMMLSSIICVANESGDKFKLLLFMP